MSLRLTTAGSWWAAPAPRRRRPRAGDRPPTRACGGRRPGPWRRRARVPSGRAVPRPRREESEVGEPDLGQGAPRAGTAATAGPGRPGDQDEPSPPAACRTRKSRPSRTAARDRLGVVQHEDDGAARSESRADSRTSSEWSIARRPGMRTPARSAPARWRRSEVGPEDPREVVLLVQADPAHRSGGRAGAHPGTRQDGLARPGRSADQGQRTGGGRCQQEKGRGRSSTGAFMTGTRNFAVITGSPAGVTLASDTSALTMGMLSVVPSAAAVRPRRLPGRAYTTVATPWDDALITQIGLKDPQARD